MTFKKTFLIIITGSLVLASAQCWAMTYEESSAAHTNSSSPSSSFAKTDDSASSSPRTRSTFTNSLMSSQFSGSSSSLPSSLSSQSSSLASVSASSPSLLSSTFPATTSTTASTPQSSVAAALSAASSSSSQPTPISHQLKKNLDLPPWLWPTTKGLVQLGFAYGFCKLSYYSGKGSYHCLNFTIADPIFRSAMRSDNPAGFILGFIPGLIEGGFGLTLGGISLLSTLPGAYLGYHGISNLVKAYKAQRPPPAGERSTPHPTK